MDPHHGGGLADHFDDCDRAQRQVRRSGPHRENQTGAGPARHPHLGRHRPGEHRPAVGIFHRRRRSQTQGPDRFGHAPQLLRRRRLRLSRHRARRQLHQHGEPDPLAYERHHGGRRIRSGKSETRGDVVGSGPAHGRRSAVQGVARIRRQGVVHGPPRPDVRAEESGRRRQARLQRLRLLRHADPRPFGHPQPEAPRPLHPRVQVHARHRRSPSTR